MNTLENLKVGPGKLDLTQMSNLRGGTGGGTTGNGGGHDTGNPPPAIDG